MPAFCGTIVGAYTTIQLPLRLLYDCTYGVVSGHTAKLRRIRRTNRRTLPRLLAALISAWFSLRLLGLERRRTNGTDKKSAGSLQSLIIGNEDSASISIKTTPTDRVPAGNTIDLTLFAATRAADAIMIFLWRRRSWLIKPTYRDLSSLLSRQADTLIFALSSGTIMWTWIYLPNRLPKRYNKWISEIAQIDRRLLEILRKARAGSFIYGEDKGQDARLLQAMCKEYEWPLQWGDPEKMIPIPCEVVHMGTGPSCHWHAVVRFSRAFHFALATNLPLQLLVKMISRRRFSSRTISLACRDAVRSSVFLGAFVALMYYGICISRSCVGPKIFNRQTVTPQMWDSGLCVRAGCILCGWSILIEAEKKRQELAMFVAPRALATQLPREYDPKDFWKERLAFSLSTALLFTIAQEDVGMVRGIFGKLLRGVLSY